MGLTGFNRMRREKKAREEAKKKVKANGSKPAKKKDATKNSKA